MSIADAVQNILTKGLDAAQSIALAKLQVNDPTPYVTGPNGQRVPVGQSGFTSALNSVPPLVWIAGLGIIGAVLLIPLLKRR